jgi:hypothetical protein
VEVAEEDGAVVGAPAVQPRVILSRKGFDSSAGGGPSPILPDGRMLSLPIPDRPDGTVRYADIAWGAGTLLDLLRQLGYARFDEDAVAHLDPDLVAACYPRAPRWTALFGQVGAAATHLNGHRVGAGDLFLFWGLFRHTRERVGGRLRFAGQPFHAIFGYLEVDRVLAAGAGEAVPFAPEFPHFRPRYRGTNCRVYVARPRLSGTGLPGFGVFRYGAGLRLSAPDGRGVTDWQLPACLHPTGGASLSYHGDPARWGAPTDGRVRLKTVCRGQEFVASPHPEITAWAHALIAAHA